MSLSATGRVQFVLACLFIYFSPEFSDFWRLDHFVVNNKSGLLLANLLRKIVMFLVILLFPLCLSMSASLSFAYCIFSTNNTHNCFRLAPHGASLQGAMSILEIKSD